MPSRKLDVAARKKRLRPIEPPLKPQRRSIQPATKLQRNCIQSTMNPQPNGRLTMFLLREIGLLPGFRSMHDTRMAFSLLLAPSYNKNNAPVQPTGCREPSGTYSECRSARGTYLTGSVNGQAPC